MKYKIGIVAVVAAIIIWTILVIRSDYSWSERIMDDKIKQGWTVVTTLDNFGDLIRPWTWVKTPITSIWFMRDDRITYVTQDIMAAQVLRVSYNYDKTEQDAYIELFDVKQNKSAILKRGVAIENVDIKGLEWIIFQKGTPGEKLLFYIKQRKGH